MELTDDESKRILRRIELEAYSALVTALRAQGELDREKKRLLRELGEQLSISTERHRAEIRRAISDDRLSMIAECVCGSDVSVEWESEGRRVVPLMPRLVPQTAFTGTATAAANHAASVNSTISTSAKARTREHEDDDVKSKKRQRTTSPKLVQKVIVSSIPKTTTQRDSVFTAAGRSTNIISKETLRLGKTSTLPIKQENTNNPISSVSMKINSGGGGQQNTSKPIILGGSKQAPSVSVATSSNKHIVPLPASCLQAHASVVSSNKNRAKLNFVKQKPKPKFKLLPTSVLKINTAPSVSQASHIVRAPQSTEKNKALEVSTPAVGKTIQVPTRSTSSVAPRGTSSVTVSPKSSISLTTFKSALQQKPKLQAQPGVLRTVETSSRHVSGQLAKTTSVPRLSRPLPAILPKAIPPKSLSSIAAAGRKLASILPAPAKSSTSSISNPVILPTTSSPIPIAPLPRPPQSFHSLTSTVLSKVPAVSLTTGSSAAVKRENREICRTSSTSEVVVLSSAVNSSPSLPSKPQERVHGRGSFSPVSDILTLVTSPSSVPFVSSSPMKTKPRTTGAALNEISLKCDETLSEAKDFLKEEPKLTFKDFSSLPASTQQCVKQGTLEAGQIKVTSTNNDNLQILNKHGHHTPTCPVSSEKTANTPLLEIVSSTLAIQPSKQVVEDVQKANESVKSVIDLSPLVNELLSSSSVVTKLGKDVEKSVDITKPCSSDTVVNISEGTAKNVGQLGLVNYLTDLQKKGKDLGANPVVSQRKLEDVDNVEIVDAPPVKKFEDVNQVTFARKHKSGDETNNMKNLAEDTGPTMRKVVEDYPNDGVKVAGELLVTEKENPVQLSEIISDKKANEKTNKFPVDAKDIEKSEEINLPSPKKDDEKWSLSEIVETCTLEGLTKPQQSTFIESKKFEDDKTRSLEYKREVEQLIVSTEQNLGNSSPLRESMQLTAPTTKHIRKQSESSVVESKTETEHLVVMTKMEQHAVEYSLTADGKDNDQLSVKPMKNLSLLDEASKETISGEEPPIAVTTTSQSACSSQSKESQDIDDKLESPSKTDNRLDSNEDQFSGSDTGSTEGGFIRTSGRKRKAPPPRDLSLSLHPPGWIRGALLLLQRISRFRGNARMKGEPSASSWFTKPVEAADAPGYHKIIKNPMDFGTIKLKLEAAEYSDHVQFHADMLLVKTNCYKYNPPGHDVRRDCDEVFQFYEAEYERFAEKLERGHQSSAKKAKPLSSGIELK